MIAIVDYGMGNLSSVRQAFEDLGVPSRLAGTPESLDGVDHLVLPGVGAFAAAMRELSSRGWDDALRRWVREDRPLLGICLGMQVLADEGEEGGAPTPGLGFIPGSVKRLDVLGCTLRLPHVGWNSVTPTGGSEPLFSGIHEDTDFYFVHSFAFDTAGERHAVAFTEYGTRTIAAVRAGNTWGVQFHPEKSSKAGRQLLRNFVRTGPC